MIESHTAVLERETPLNGGYATEPYETAWASEAIFFATVRGDVEGHDARVQISPDGMRWCDEGTVIRVEPGQLTHAKVSHFGGWLRIMADRVPPGESALTVVLTVKG